jgi:leucyl-tRNA synthetase
MFEFVNTATSTSKLTANQLNQFVLILAPFAPHIAQEIFTKLGGNGYIAIAEWPTFDPEKLVADNIELPVQIMGKVRGRVSVSTNASDEEVKKAALSDPNIRALLETLTIRKIIIVPNKIINIVAN